MKKIIAIAMAVVMMMTIAVPAFANTQYDNGTAGSSTDVLVDGITDMGEGTYTVTIPATIDLDWGATQTESQYSVTCQLQTGKRVFVEYDVTSNLINQTDANEEIPFEAYNRADTGYTAASVVTDEVHKLYVYVETTDWDAATIAAYKGMITFTSAIV